MKNLFATILFSFIFCSVSGQVLNDEERLLYRLIMEYRNEMGLPNIPLSRSLTTVAQTHVRDLDQNNPNQGPCNLHSWSSNGTWTACCYTRDHANASCMWNKPRELTNYKGDGYEISYGSYGATATAEGALNGWKKSSGHNAVIINQGIWDDKWNAIGIGLSNGFAVVWFGKEYDYE
jgi:hypothetical protein